MSEHNHSLKPYVLVLLALFGLTGATVAAAYIDFGHPWSDVVALALALCKSSLVVYFFMHVRGSTSLIKFAVFTGITGMLIFFVLILNDYFTRSIDYVTGV